MHFAELLPVDTVAGDRFVIKPPGSGFLYGGLSLAMSLRAAAATVDAARSPLSLHATFLAGGAWEGPHELEVQRFSDSGTFSGRRVETTTANRLAVVADAVFHRPGVDDDWQAVTPVDVAVPDDLEPFRDKMPAPVLEVRTILPASQNVMERVHPLWARPLEPVDDPVLRACALAFASDYRVFSSPFPAGSGQGDGLISRTYSHTLVFHRPLPLQGWWLIRCEPLSVSGGRFLSRGTMQDTDGTLLASFVQLGYIRSAKQHD